MCIRLTQVNPIYSPTFIIYLDNYHNGFEYTPPNRQWSNQRPTQLPRRQTLLPLSQQQSRGHPRLRRPPQPCLRLLQMLETCRVPLLSRRRHPCRQSVRHRQQRQVNHHRPRGCHSAKRLLSVWCSHVWPYS